MDKYIIERKSSVPFLSTKGIIALLVIIAAVMTFYIIGSRIGFLSLFFAKALLKFKAFKILKVLLVPFIYIIIRKKEFIELFNDRIIVWENRFIKKEIWFVDIENIIDKNQELQILYKPNQSILLKEKEMEENGYLLLVNEISKLHNANKDLPLNDH